ncbi:MAG: lipoyl domain-containing protein, partial [Pseudomonas sp.]
MSELPMPKFGLTMTEGQILEWRKTPGERFAKGEILFVVETEKVANEVEAEADGELLEILAGEEQTVAVGLPIAHVAYDGAAGPAGGAPAAADAEAPPK